jgi:hypothetical protein
MNVSIDKNTNKVIRCLGTVFLVDLQIDLMKCVLVGNMYRTESHHKLENIVQHRLKETWGM